MPALPHVTWLKSFEAAARHSSFSSAAAELNLTPAAVSQQIRLLEQHLKAQLFQRLPRGVKLTDIGLASTAPVARKRSLWFSFPNYTFLNWLSVQIKAIAFYEMAFLASTSSLII